MIELALESLGMESEIEAFCNANKLQAPSPMTDIVANVYMVCNAKTFV
jgi:hypothetical protein